MVGSMESSTLSVANESFKDPYLPIMKGGMGDHERKNSNLEKSNKSNKEEKRTDSIRKRKLYKTIVNKKETRGFSFKILPKYSQSQPKNNEMFEEMKYLLEKIYFPDLLQFNLNLKIAKGIFQNMNHILVTRNVEFTTEVDNDFKKSTLMNEKLENNEYKIKNFNKEIIVLYSFGFIVFIVSMVVILLAV